jgi:hypothetical protein
VTGGRRLARVDVADNWTGGERGEHMDRRLRGIWAHRRR